MGLWSLPLYEMLIYLRCVVGTWGTPARGPHCHLRKEAVGPDSLWVRWTTCKSRPHLETVCSCVSKETWKPAWSCQGDGAVSLSLGGNSREWNHSHGAWPLRRRGWLTGSGLFGVWKMGGVYRWGNWSLAGQVSVCLQSLGVLSTLAYTVTLQSCQVAPSSGEFGGR